MLSLSQVLGAPLTQGLTLAPYQFTLIHLVPETTEGVIFKSRELS